MDNNTSPYPFIPASYYVDLKKPTKISIFVYDADSKEMILVDTDKIIDVASFFLR